MQNHTECQCASGDLFDRDNGSQALETGQMSRMLYLAGEKMAQKTTEYSCDVVVCSNETRGADAKSEDPLVRELIDSLSHEVVRHGLSLKVRVSKTNCMGFAGAGLKVALYPYGIWFSDVSEADVDRIVARVRQIIRA